ncbi:MAG: hypothetical protein Q8O51_01480 [bacterium]|nr:hypothetical protein [bacterium]
MNPADLRKHIESAINTGRVHMRPRWHFVLRAIIRVAAVTLTGLVVLFLVSFVLFTLRASGVGVLTGFGWRGMIAYVTSLPWLIIVITLSLLVLLEIGIRRFGIGYRRPIAYTLLGILFALAVGGVILARTNLHTRWDTAATDQRLPVVGGLYRGFGPRAQHAVTQGVILETTMSGFTLQADSGETYMVTVEKSARIPTPEAITPGARVMVGGDVKNSTINAFGVRPATDDWQPGRGFRRGQ